MAAHIMRKGWPINLLSAKREITFYSAASLNHPGLQVTKYGSNKKGLAACV